MWERLTLGNYKAMGDEAIPVLNCRCVQNLV